MRITALLLGLILFLACAGPAGAIEYPLSISADGRSLLDAQGDAVVLNAATPWHLGARLTREEVVEYLDARAGQNVNALLMALMVTDGYSTGTTANAYGEVPFLAPGDFARPNEAYFAHVDWIIEQAELRGIVMLITPLYLGYACGPEGWCAEAQAAGPDKIRDFGRWVGDRYRDQPNIIWVQGGDADAAAYGAMGIVDAMAGGILERDTVHLHTAHCRREMSGRDCYDRPWLDFDTTYADCSTTPAQARGDYERIPWMPTVYIEGRYEFEQGATNECIRAQAWWSALGGLVGHFYGSGRIWDFPSGWRNGLESAGTASMAHLGRILEARGWGDLVPDYGHNVMVAGYGNIDDASWAATATRSDRNSVLAYIPSPRTVSIAMNRVEGTEADAWWIDPSTGQGELIGRFPTSGTRDFATPGPGDWVLIIDNASAPFSDVWTSPATSADAPTAARVRIVSASPNPFNPRTVIRFTGPAGTRIDVTAYDARGRLVERMYAGTATGSVQALTWEAGDLASGTYFVRVSGTGQSATMKVAVLK